MDEKRYRAVVDECMKLAISRNEVYGDSVDCMRLQSMIDLCIMKLSRIRMLGDAHPKTKDEMTDVLNYLVFAIEKFNLGVRN